MKNKYFFFVFRHRYRNRALNNFIKIKKIKNYYLINLSGIIKYILFGIPIIYLVSIFRKFFKNFVLISCDGKPQIKYNSVNFWFGGTSYKVPKEFSSYKNNCFFFENFSKKEENIINLYPYKPKNIIEKKKPKIVFVGAFNIIEDEQVDMIWEKEKENIFKSYSIIDSTKFWKNYDLENHRRLQYYYIQLKERIRFYSIIAINNKFKKDFILIGSKWKKYITNSSPDVYDIEIIKKLYNGNICIDFGSKWGCNYIYPRSVEIIESGGLLVQVQQNNFSDKSKNLNDFNKFNSIQELIDILKVILESKKSFEDIFLKQYRSFSNDELNYSTLTKIFNISKKNNL